MNNAVSKFHEHIRNEQKNGIKLKPKKFDISKLIQAFNNKNIYKKNPCELCGLTNEEIENCFGHGCNDDDLIMAHKCLKTIIQALLISPKYNKV